MRYILHYVPVSEQIWGNQQLSVHLNYMRCVWFISACSAGKLLEEVTLFACKDKQSGIEWNLLQGYLSQQQQGHGAVDMKSTWQTADKETSPHEYITYTLLTDIQLVIIWCSACRPTYGAPAAALTLTRLTLLWITQVLMVYCICFIFSHLVFTSLCV